MTLVESHENLILYGTQTGTAEELATELHEKLIQNGIVSSMVNMFDTNIKELPNFTHIYIIVSTWGDGDPPDDGEDLHDELLENTNIIFNNTNYSVFALGDSSFENFCKCGIDFDMFMEKAGAIRTQNLVFADVDFEEKFEQWIDLIASDHSKNNSLAKT